MSTRAETEVRGEHAWEAPSDRPDPCAPGAPQGEEILSSVMECFAPRCWIPGLLELKAPWGVEVATPWGWFYLAAGRPCTIEVDGIDGPLTVSAGDLLVLPQGCPHRLRDAPDRPTVPIQELLKPGAVGGRGLSLIRGDGASTRLFCGCFLLDQLEHSSWLATMPSVMRIPGEGRRPRMCVEHLVRLISYEAASAEPGARIVVNQLVRTLLLKAASTYLAELPPDRVCWLQALTDPEIGRALELMHGEPAAPWTVAVLAKRLDMARSTFSARFTRLVGRPPLEYLTQWRMQKAGQLLRTAHAEVKEVAARVGYRSAAAFSKTFARWAGAAPGAYRRARDSGTMSNRAGEVPG